MTHLRFPSSLGFAFIAAAALAAFNSDAAYGQAGNGPGNNYYPQLDSPLNGNPALSAIQAKLLQVVRTTKTTTGFTYKIPSLLVPVSDAVLNNSPAVDNPDGYVLANDLEINTALGQVMADLLSAPGPLAPNAISDLVSAISNYRQATIAKFIPSATQVVLSQYQAPVGEVDGPAKDARLAALRSALEQITSASTAANPAQGSAIVAAMLKLVAPSLKATTTQPIVSVPNADFATDIVGRAVEEAGSVADVIVKTAITTVKTVIDSNDPTVANRLITNISAEAINAVFGSHANAGYMGYKVGLAIGTATKGATVKVGTAVNPIATSSDVVNSIFQTDGTGTNAVFGNLTDHPENAKYVATVITGLMKGFSGSLLEGGTDSTSDNITSAVKTALKLDSNAAAATYFDAVKFGFQTAKTASLNTDPTIVGTHVTDLINDTNKNNIAAILAGAEGWLPTAAPAMIAVALDKDSRKGGGGSVSDIVEAAIRGSIAKASTIALNAANWGKVSDSALQGVGDQAPEGYRLGQVLQGAAQALGGQPLYNTMIPTVVASILKASPAVILKDTIVTTNMNLINSAQFLELARFGVMGAESAGNAEAIGIIVKALATAVMKATTGYQFVLQGAIDASSVGTGTPVSVSNQWRVVLGAMAADKLHAAAISTYARSGTLSGYQSTNDDQVIAGGDIIISLQTTPKQAFGNMYNAFSAPSVAGTEANAIAVLTGANLVIPANAAQAAALAVKLTNASEASIRQAAVAAMPSLAKNIGFTITVAEHVKAGTSDLFDYLDQMMFQNSKFAADIVTGATIVQPGYAHIIAHAAGFRAPASASKFVPALFNYSRVTSLDPLVQPGDPLLNSFNNTVAVTAAITAGLTKGILEAKVGNTLLKPLEQNYLKATVSALIKQAQALHSHSNTFRQSDGLSTSTFTLTTEVGAAGAITGMLSQVFKTTDTALTAEIAAILTAAATVVKKVPNDVLAVAQAAAQTVRLMNPTFSDAAGITNALVLGVAGLVTQDKIANAVAFGFSEADGGKLPAGAAGVINFIQSPITGAPVTSIFEL